MGTSKYAVVGEGVGVGVRGGLPSCNGLASHPEGVAILLVASCYRNRDKLWQYEPLGLRDLTLVQSKCNYYIY